MASLPAEPKLESLRDTYPFPLAFILQVDVLQAGTAQAQAEGLIRLANAALQYAALIAVSSYVAAPFKHERVSYAFERLKRPLVSDFANFLRASVPVLRAQGALFVPELATTLGRFQGEQVQALRMGEHGLEERPLPLLDAVVNLRNALAHDRYRGRWAQFVERHAPLVARLLDAMDWCVRYPLLRLVAGGQWVPLMGAEPTFPIQPIPATALDELARAQQAGELTGLLVGDPARTRFLNLYPFVLWADCPQCEQEPLLGLAQEVFLFNGDEGRRYVAYIGVRHPRPMSAPKPRLDALYADKEVPLEPITLSHLSYPALYERARRQSETWLAENLAARRYIPQVYYPRHEIEAELERFVGGDKTGFLLLGEAGIGKTNLLCHQVEAGRARGEPVLFYAGHQLQAGEDLETRLLRDLHLAGDFPQLLACLRREGRQLLLVVDGVNEHEDAPALLKALCAFVARYAPGSPVTGPERPAVKAVLSFRATYFQKTLQALFAGGGDEASLFPAVAFQTHVVEAQGRPTETYRFTLERVGADELQALYEGYRAYAGQPDREGRVRRFCPTTPFTALSLAVRSILGHPWYLRMIVEAYDAQPVPAALWTSDILQTYCDAKIYGRTPEEQERFAERARLVDELVGLLRQYHADSFRRDDLHDLSPRWSRTLLEHEVVHSPYLQLLSEGVLLETPETDTAGRRPRTRYVIRFAFEPLFEYLLSEQLLREAGGWPGLTGARLAALLDEAKSFQHLTGAVELLLIEAAQADNLALLADTLNTADAETAAAVLVRVLLALHGIGHASFGPLLDALAARGEPQRALTVLRDASFDFGERQEFRPMLACAERAEAVGQRLPAEAREGVAELVAAALVNRGAALHMLGRLADARACQERAIGIYRYLVERRGRRDLGGCLAKALMNLGLGLSGLGRPREAVPYLDEAVALYRDLVERAGRAELANDLAMALMNAGNLQSNLGRPGEAVAAFDEAITIRRRLVEGEGRHDLVHRLAMALMNKGNALDDLGRHDEALACHDEATTLYRGLVEGGRAELTHDLARAIANRGRTLGNLGRYGDAAACFAQAIGAYRRLVEHEGRGELAHELAGALQNQGVALNRQGDYDAAIACYDEAIGLYDRAANGDARGELARALAQALSNKGGALRNGGRMDESLACYAEAVRRLERCVQAGTRDLLPALLGVIRDRLLLSLNLERWSEAAADTLRGLEYALPYLQAGTAPPALAQDCKLLLGGLLTLPPDVREEVYSRLGAGASMVRRYVER